jgi:CHAT domain-containing protein
VSLQKLRQQGRQREEYLHRSGLTDLVWPEDERTVARGVSLLERAVRKKPEDARLRSDLAAALYVLGQKLDEPAHLVRALSEISMAVRFDPSLAEARFNRALILERMFLLRSAQREWEEYLQLEDISGWKEEAQHHLATLARPSLSDLWRQQLSHLREAGSRSDRRAVKAIVLLSPQAAREHAIEDLLGEWGFLVEKRRLADSREALQIAREIGEVLRTETGELSVAGAIEAIDQVQADPLHLERTRTLSRGHQAFRDAMHSFRGMAMAEASTQFQEARDHLLPSGSPIALWASSGIARVQAYGTLDIEAEAMFERVIPWAEQRELGSLLGWAHWGLAWLQLHQGRLTEALPHLVEARSSYQRSGERENLGAIESLLGENMFLLGQGATSWRHRYLALKALSDFPSSSRLHNVLLEGASTAAEHGLMEVELIFQEELLELAHDVGSPVQLAEYHWARSRSWTNLGQQDRAREELERARAVISKVPDGSPKRKLLADLHLSEGRILYEADPRGALQTLTDAIEAYRQLDCSWPLAEALLMRARVHFALGSDGKGTEDFESALTILEHPFSVIDGRDLQDLQAAYSESIQSIYDEVIRIQAGREKMKALELLERARSLQAPSMPSLALDAIPRHIVVVEYAVLEDRLLIWTLGRGRLQLTTHPIRAEALGRTVDRFLRRIRHGTSPESLAESSSDLYRLLIPDAIAACLGNCTVYFVPDKILQKVPFAALRNPRTSRFLVEEHRLAISSSLGSILRRGSGGSARKGDFSALLVGNPKFDDNLFSGFRDLPGAYAEIEGARGFFKSPLVLVGEEATRPRVLKELDQHDVFVYAGHSVSSLFHPSRSYLLLAPSGLSDSGLLFADEIAGRRFRRLRLVVLSACESLGPRSARSLGLSGMAEPFLQAGARAVVGSLWRLEDQGAAEVMSTFYSEIADGKDAVSALRSAQIGSLRTKKNFKSWSAFQVVTSPGE